MSTGIIGPMTPTVALSLLAALVLGGVIGWLAHAARSGDRLARAEAGLAARIDAEEQERRVAAHTEDESARRQAGAVGAQVQQIIAPLHEVVGTLSERLHHIETERARAFAGLTEQVAGMHRTSRELADQTGRLAGALQSPQVRGRWGEVQLERVVELAGMARHCDFDTQVSAPGPDGTTVRPDMVIRLAGGRQIIVDAKVPLTGYLQAIEQTRPQDREAAMFRHAAQLRTHVDQLAAKSYWRAFDPTPEFVVLFVPGDSFLDAALTTDPALLEYAFHRNVVLTTPTTLIALLRTVALTWRQEEFGRQAAEVHALGRELLHRIDVFARHLDRTGTQLGKAVESFNATAASMQSRVMVTARRLSELSGTDEPTPIRSVDDMPRPVAGNPAARHSAVSSTGSSRDPVTLDE